jgi:hypothetical protein
MPTRNVVTSAPEVTANAAATNVTIDHRCAKLARASPSTRVQTGLAAFANRLSSTIAIG